MQEDALVYRRETRDKSFYGRYIYNPVVHLTNELPPICARQIRIRESDELVRLRNRYLEYADAWKLVMGLTGV